VDEDYRNYEITKLMGINMKEKKKRNGWRPSKRSNDFILYWITLLLFNI